MGPAELVVIGSLAALVGIAAASALIMTLFAPPTATAAGGRIRSALKNGFATAVITTLVGSVAAAGALALTNLLTASEAPTTTYLVIGALCLFTAFRKFRLNYNGMDGCGDMLVCVWAAYGVVWSVAGAVLLGGPLGPAPDALLSIGKPLLAAAPPVLALLVLTRKQRRWKTAGAIWLVLAAFCALVFFPVEQGFGAEFLPSSDWLRFPAAGMAAALAALAAFYVPVALLGAMGGKGSALPSKLRLRRAKEKATGHGIVILCAGLLGLTWALTRWAANLV